MVNLYRRRCCWQHVLLAWILSKHSEGVRGVRVDRWRWQLAHFLEYLPASVDAAIATLAVLSFQGTWEEYFTALVIIKDEALRTLPIALLMFNDKYATNYSWVFSASIIALIPTIILYIIFQKDSYRVDLTKAE